MTNRAAKETPRQASKLHGPETTKIRGGLVDGESKTSLKLRADTKKLATPLGDRRRTLCCGRL